MKHIHLLQLRVQCILFAAQNGMVADLSQDDTFLPRGGGSVLCIPYQHILNSVLNGWEIEDVLQNETCYDEAS